MTTKRPVYNLSPQSSCWNPYTPIEMLEKQLRVVDEMFDSIKWMKKNLESDTSRAFIAKMEEIKAAFDDVIEDATIAIEALQSQAVILDEIERETTEIEEMHYNENIK